jgi:O-antigen ligase
MLVIVIYSVSRHLSYGLFNKNAAHFVMEPFFRDHTSYGAVLALLFFATGGLFLNKKRNVLFTILLGGSWLMLTIGLILSYTRAAWISVIIAFCVLILIHFRIKVKYLIIPALLIVAYLFGQRTEIIHKMEKNRQASSAAFSEHIKSISNITTDDSNLERLNRWNAAFRMSEEKPLFGWGPGTYMFKYAPYQRSYDKTAISTDFGDLGNAHSEYIGPLVETGIPGVLSFLLLCITGLITGMRVYRQMEDRKLKRTILFLYLGFITYLIHGMLNNFLDTDKASALFWGILAVFVSLDLSLKELNAQH